MTKQPKAPIEPEFSHPLKVDKIPAAGLTLTLKPNEKQRMAIAKRFELLSLDELVAEIKVTHQSFDTHTLLVEGNLTAKAVQECVVTLEPLPVKIDIPIRVTYIEGAEGTEESRELDLIHDDDDIEYMENGALDVGELITQHFGVALEPYPRKLGIDPVEVTFGEEEKPENPFLKLVKTDKSSKD